MIECPHEQGTADWHLDRLGIPTGSMFSKIVTSTGKPSTSSKAYMNQLLADWVAGKPIDAFEPTQAMQDGTDREEGARDLYSFVSGNDVSQIGFCFKDDKKLVGVSPDGLVGDNGLVEIKNPKGATLIGYKLANKLPSTYVQQVQGQMWVMQREWCDFFTAHPDLPHFIIRVERDDKFIKLLESEVDKFIETMLEKREKLAE